MSLTVSWLDDQPKVIISEEAMADMRYITEKVSTEVGWLATVEKVSEWVFRIVEVFLPEQEVHSTTTEMQPEHLEAFSLELLDQRGIETYNALRCWGHSHISMPVSPSGQDNTTLARLTSDTGEPFIAIRTNKQGNVQVDIGLPNGMRLNDVPTAVESDSAALAAKWDDAIKQKVKTFAPKVLTGTAVSWRQKYKGRSAGYDLDFGYGYGYGHDYGFDDVEPDPKWGKTEAFNEEEEAELWDQYDAKALEHGLMAYDDIKSEEAQQRWINLIHDIIGIEDDRDEEVSLVTQYPHIQLDGYDPEEECDNRVSALVAVNQDLIDFTLPREA